MTSPHRTAAGYRYQILYTCTDGMRVAQTTRDEPIRTEGDRNRVAQNIAEQLGHTNVTVLTWSQYED